MVDCNSPELRPLSEALLIFIGSTHVMASLGKLNTKLICYMKNLEAESLSFYMHRYIYFLGWKSLPNHQEL